MTTPATTKKTFTVERMLKASPEKVWQMWTTREGLERWWGPEGFSVQVLHIDVRVGGHFELIMKTDVPEIVAMLKEGGMGASHRLRGDYTVVEPSRRLAYTNAVDFVPGVPPTPRPPGSTSPLPPVAPTSRSPTTSCTTRCGPSGRGWAGSRRFGKLERALA